MGNIYLENKFVESIIYDKELEEKLKDHTLEEKLDINFLKYLNKYLEINTKTQTIDKKVQKRLYEIIRYIRFNKGQQANVEYNEELNKAIIMINQMTTENCLKFYYDQMNARAHDSSTSTFDEKMQNLLKLYDNLCYSICHDYEIICDLRKTPKEYLKLISKYTGKEYGWFLCSVKGINFENPQLFEEQNVKDNLGMTILQGSINGLNKNLKRSTNEVKTKILKR